MEDGEALTLFGLYRWVSLRSSSHSSGLHRPEEANTHMCDVHRYFILWGRSTGQRVPAACSPGPEPAVEAAVLSATGGPPGTTQEHLPKGSLPVSLAFEKCRK